MLAVAIALAAPTAAHAVPEYPLQIFTKLGRGAMNILMSPAEIVTNVYKQKMRVPGYDMGYQEWTWTDAGVAAFSGGVVGVGYMLTHIGVGFFEVVTFPWPTGPVMLPPTPTVYLEGVMQED
jgi:hypothetical protein